MLSWLFHQSAPRLLFLSTSGYAKRLSQQLHPSYLHGLHPAVEAEFSLQARLVTKAVKFNSHVFSVTLAITLNTVTSLNAFLR